MAPTTSPRHRKAHRCRPWRSDLFPRRATQRREKNCNCPVLPILVFFWNMERKTTIKTRIYYIIPTEPWNHRKRRGKRSKNTRNSSQGNSIKKLGKEGQGATEIFVVSKEEQHQSLHYINSFPKTFYAVKFPVIIPTNLTYMLLGFSNGFFVFWLWGGGWKGCWRGVGEGWGGVGEDLAFYPEEEFYPH